MRRFGIGSALAGLLGFGVGLSISWFTTDRPTTTSRLSPDETIRARLVEISPSWGMDRNFVVRLEFLEDGKTTVIYRSPDEGKPAGSERLIWSKDGTWLLLVGRHFYVKEDLFLDNGDQLYFLYHLPSDRGWCNADMPTIFPPLTAEAIQGVKFTEPVTMKASPVP